MRLRAVQPGDLDVYLRMRCDPVMMTELGGPLPREGIAAKVQRDVDDMASGQSWILMILPDETDAVAGSVVLWSHAEHGEPISEIGWMVLPEFQGRGLGKAAVRDLLERARDEPRWEIVHAFPGVTNAPSNGICRALGFSLVGEQDALAFGDRPLRVNHWRVNSRTELPAVPRSSEPISALPDGHAQIGAVDLQELAIHQPIGARRRPAGRADEHQV